MTEQVFQLTPFEWGALWAILGVGILGLVYGLFLVFTILREDQGTQEMIRVARSIQLGARAYLVRQFKAVALLVVILGVALFFTSVEDKVVAFGRSFAFLLGAVFSAMTGAIGMSLAVRGNVRTAQAATHSFRKALKIAFRTGAITGMFCTGLGIIGATVIFMIYQEKCYEVLVGFGFGGCLLALFMRVGGGIYTKAADVGADLVGKIEAGIPEDDPRNAAVIADNVGDNVGDCAGMAADLFESYEVTLVAAMILGYAAYGAKGVIFPLIVRGIGVITSIIGTYMVQAKSEDEHAMVPIQRAFVVSALLSAVLFFFPACYYVNDIRCFWATLTGILLAVGISILTEYFTTTTRAPVKEIAKATQTGPATTILSGFASGLESSVWAILLIGAAMLTSMLIFSGDPSKVLYGIALCGMGMLTTVGVVVSMDSYGPVTDNAHGIGEMAHVKGEKLTDITTRLDAVGNTTKAITKGFAIATAVVAAVSLFSSYIETTLNAGIYNCIIDGARDFAIRVNIPSVFIGLLIGGAVPFLFSSLTIKAVGRAAYLIVQEVRRQFKEIPGLMEGKADPDSARCVDICTAAAQKELVGPGLMAILTPIIVGFTLGVEALGGYLVGTILVGQLMAVFMANAGGAWDNAKKIIELGGYGGKGTDCHKAGIIGDTVGDPLKDTAGPALNPLIKVMNLIALLIIPLIISYPLTEHGVVNPIVAFLMIAALAVVGWAIWRSKRESF